MTNAIIGYDEIMNRVESLEREKKGLMDWYKQRIEIMSARIQREKLSK